MTEPEEQHIIVVGISGDEVRAMTFPPTRKRTDGYEAAAVDEFLAKAADALERGEDLTQMVEQARFPIARSQGYRAGEVDDFLDRLADEASGSIPPPPPSTGGWWSRLFS